MKKEVLLGDEAVALGAVHAGLSIGYSYPGTPASEIMEYLIRSTREEKGFRAEWCVNEKVAYEQALGVSYSGKRTLISMKHVGLNVAADPFMNSALVRINGGLVIVTADDPGMHSSQNEQDNRAYAQFAGIPCLEPSDQQEAYNMTRTAFDISERFHVPVMIRVVTRLAHSRAQVETGTRRPENEVSRSEWRDWTLLPANSRRHFDRLMKIQPEILETVERSEYNRLELNPQNRSFGVIASGIGVNYVRENLGNQPDVPSVLKVTTIPLPVASIKKLVAHVDRILVVEEGFPLIERQIQGLFGIHDKTVLGKLSGHIPLTGELTADTVRQALEMEPRPQRKAEAFSPVGRPPQLCRGCPHIDTLDALTRILENHAGSSVFSDIGCYTLGALPPYSAIDTCVCMGASVSMAKGGADAGIHPAIAVIGDSTFAHSGMTPLLDAATMDTPMTVIIVDNAIVAMTGGQPTFASGDKLERIVLGLGVPQAHVKRITPLPRNREENMRVIQREIEHKGISVIISTRECIQEARKKKKRGAR